MTGQCDFLRKFPNFLRNQGVSAFSVYPPLSLCMPVPFPCPIHHPQPFVQFQPNQGKGLMDMTALWAQGENS